MHADDTEHPLAPGALLAGRYRVGERIGSGGTASVHRGRDELLGRDVALKAVTHGASDPAAHERERTEVELLARLSHRALVTVFDAVSARVDGHDSIVVVMELVDGPTLSQRRAEGPIADAELLRMARDLAEALAVVHAAGIVHRDVKPSNILLAPSPLAEHDFDARLADFGIAAVDGGGELTATGAVLGTAAYLSPEQATGGTVGPAADVYALGLVLLETITGEREFAGPAIEALTARMLRDPVMPPALDERWAWLLRGMTAREPAERPTTDEVRELLAALDGVPVQLAAPVESDVATTAVPLADQVEDADSGARTALLPAVGAAALDSDTAPVAVGAASDADAEHLPARRRRRIAVLATVGVVLVAGAVSAGALAIQGLGQQDASPSAPADEADRTTPSPTPSPSASPSPSPTTSPSPSATPSATPTPTTTAPQPQPSTPATTTPAEPAPTTTPPTDPEPTTTPTDPAPSESPAPTETTPADPAPSPSP
ncbi:serine/threonine-protein kinase [Agrococcus jejuensis]|uniref:non-specific serine/threonine protein kinase n=1 Tax=Agrococcus jejuensis TaxID=399736 RepID=A0A1G8D3I1_9MICO|nr:serine/threonine-protein kinase [Agrococcus jejuensis]SDH52251.1 Serine/threonine protein kinase [Agrococcus jejuensis]